MHETNFLMDFLFFLSFHLMSKNDRLQRVGKYTSIVQNLTATLGMDSSTIITKVHPSLNELSGLSKNISDSILAKLNSTVESLQDEKRMRLEKVKVTRKYIISLLFSKIIN